MEAVIRKWGQCPAVRLPVSAIKEAEFRLERRVNLTVTRDRIAIEPSQQVAYDPGELVGGTTASAVLAAIDGVPSAVLADQVRSLDCMVGRAHEQAMMRELFTERRIALKEIALRAKPSDCCMEIRGGVYDFGAYISQHPAPPAIITTWCGKEATHAYNTMTKGRPHSPYADELLAKYRIGALDTGAH